MVVVIFGTKVIPIDQVTLRSRNFSGSRAFYGPGVKLTLSKVAVPRALALCEQTNSPTVALVVMVSVFETTCVLVTPSLDT